MVFHKNNLKKNSLKKFVHTPMTPYRAYINYTQKLFFEDKSKTSRKLAKKWPKLSTEPKFRCAQILSPHLFCRRTWEVSGGTGGTF